MLGIGKKKTNTDLQQAAPAVAAQPATTGQPNTAPTQAQQATAAQQGENKAVSMLKDGSVSVLDLIAPSSVEVDSKHIRVGDKFYRTFFVVDYPRQVSPNWLSILIDYKETMNISMYIYPVESKDVLSNLRRKIAEMEATLEGDAKQGMQPDIKLEAALEDAMALREELARGLERFYQFGLYVTLAATTVQALSLIHISEPTRPY